MTESERLKNGKLFSPRDDVLRAQKLITHKLNLEYNNLFEDETEKREKIIKKILGEFGEGGFIQGPVFFHYGKHTKIGKRFFANFNFTVQDDAEVVIGDDCNFGPGTTIVTPLHPMIADERNKIKLSDGSTKRVCWAKPVKIGNNCWFGANVTVCPGVTIGDCCVIGAGSVVTKDIEPNSFAVGVPCRVIRKITDGDSIRFKAEILCGDEVF